MYIKNKATNGAKFAPLPKKNPDRDHEKNKKRGGLIENTYLSFFHLFAKTCHMYVTLRASCTFDAQFVAYTCQSLH